MNIIKIAKKVFELNLQEIKQLSASKLMSKLKINSFIVTNKDNQLSSIVQIYDLGL